MQTDLTPRQIAGAANGRLAAGAKSPEGLARSAANATKHGLSQKRSGRSSVVLLNESPDAFESRLQSLAACFQPSDEHEFNLVRRMAESEWLRQRALELESAAISEAMRQQARTFHENVTPATRDSLQSDETEALRAWHAFSKLSSTNPAFATLQRYAATHARAYSRTERELRDYRIAKAESIHPTPEPRGPAATLKPSDPPENHPHQRWQPLSTVSQPDGKAPSNVVADVVVDDLDRVECPSAMQATHDQAQPQQPPQNAFGETKLSPPPPTLPPPPDCFKEAA